MKACTQCILFDFCWCDIIVHKSWQTTAQNAHGLLTQVIKMIYDLLFARCVCRFDHFERHTPFNVFWFMQVCCFYNDCKSSDVIIDHHRCFRFLLFACEGITSLPARFDLICFSFELRVSHVSPGGVTCVTVFFSGLSTWIDVCCGWMSMRPRFQAGSVEGLHHRLLDLGSFIFLGGIREKSIPKTLGLTFFLPVENTQCANKGSHVCSSILTFMCSIYVL